MICFWIKIGLAGSPILNPGVEVPAPEPVDALAEPHETGATPGREIPPHSGDADTSFGAGIAEADHAVIGRAALARIHVRRHGGSSSSVENWGSALR
ncbi:hypothetical protein Mext_2459 [Methylorubrum extorquens PA1]|nr:hypothetical protein Mext_2459 [Methylorubrum extorquens PA1]